MIFISWEAFGVDRLDIFKTGGLVHLGELLVKILQHPLVIRIISDRHAQLRNAIFILRLCIQANLRTGFRDGFAHHAYVNVPIP